MEKSEEIVDLLTEVSDLIRDGRASQLAALEYLRGNAEKMNTVVDRSVAL